VVNVAEIRLRRGGAEIGQRYCVPIETKKNTRKMKEENNDADVETHITPEKDQDQKKTQCKANDRQGNY